MDIKRIKLYIDRIESGIAVAFTKNGKKYTFNCDNLKLIDGDIIEACFDEKGKVSQVTVLPAETENVKKRLSERLMNLFKKSGDNK